MPWEHFGYSHIVTDVYKALEVFCHYTWHKHWTLTPFIFLNCPVALSVDNFGRRGPSRAGTGLLDSLVTCSKKVVFHIEHCKIYAYWIWGLINNIIQFFHPSKLLVFSRICVPFHLINLIKAIYMRFLGVTEAQKRIVLDHGTKTLMLKEDEKLCRVEHHYLRWTRALSALNDHSNSKYFVIFCDEMSLWLHDMFGGAQ